MHSTLFSKPLHWFYELGYRFVRGEWSLVGTSAMSVGLFLILNYLLVLFEVTLHLAALPDPLIVASKSTFLFMILTAIHVALWRCVARSHTLIRWAVRLLVINNSIIIFVYLLSAYGVVHLDQRVYMPNPNTPRQTIPLSR